MIAIMCDLHVEMWRMQAQKWWLLKLDMPVAHSVAWFLAAGEGYAAV